MTRYVFEPKHEIADWIDNYLEINRIGWTDFCYGNVYKIQKQDYHTYIKRIGAGISLCLLGMICFSLTYLALFLLLYLSLLILGLFLCAMGFYIVGWEVKNGRR